MVVGPPHHLSPSLITERIRLWVCGGLHVPFFPAFSDYVFLLSVTTPASSLSDT